MSGLDEISVSIGALNANVENINKNLEHVLTYIRLSKEEVKEALTKHVEDDKDKFTDIDNRTKSLENFQYKVYGIASVFAFIATSLTNLASGYIKTKS